jgi:hypothetical protein
MTSNFSKDRRFCTVTSAVTLLGSILGVGIVGVDTAEAVTFGSNLIQNPGAELNIGAANRTANVTPSNWTTSTVTAVQYGAGGTLPFPTATSPGPTVRGANFFAGGQGNLTSTATQLITLSPDFSVIDAGDATFDLSGFFGGYREQGDRASLTATFQNSGSTSLGNFTVGPVTAAERIAAFGSPNPGSNQATGLLSRTASGVVPTGTRNILLTLSMLRSDPTYNDGYADNLSLVLNNNTPVTSVPEPSAVPGLLVGSALVVGVIKKRKKLSEVG